MTSPRLRGEVGAKRRVRGDRCRAEAGIRLDGRKDRDRDRDRDRDKGEG